MSSIRKSLYRTTFKIDYFLNEGLPSGLTQVDGGLHRAASLLGIVGLHKHMRYRSWFRAELATYIRSALNTQQDSCAPFWNRSVLRRLADDHIGGSKNCVFDLNAVLTIQAVERLLLKGAVASAPASSSNFTELASSINDKAYRT
jgi:asparagine synthase (glutamine-hydrolysing)